MDNAPKRIFIVDNREKLDAFRKHGLEVFYIPYNLFQLMGIYVSSHKPYLEPQDQNNFYLDKIRKAIRSNDIQDIIFDTGSDREGVFLAWSLIKVLNWKRNVYMLTLKDSSESSITNGLNNLRPMNNNLAEAKVARTAIDWIIGLFMTNVLLCGNLQSSGGRVQAALLNIINTSHTTVNLRPRIHSISTQFRLSHRNDINYGPVFKVSSIHEYDDGVVQPYCKNTLFMDARVKLNLSFDEIEELAEELYNMKLITFYNTDSIHISRDAADQAAKFIRTYIGEQYVSRNLFENYAPPSNPDSHKGIHEAIRPINVNNFDLDKLDGICDQVDRQNAYKLYIMILRRFLESQMGCRFTMRRIHVTHFQEVYTACQRYKTLLLEDIVPTGHQEVHGMLIQDYQEIQIIDTPFFLNQHLYEEASPITHSIINEIEILRTLEMHGIGRPSTYATIIARLVENRLIESQNGDCNLTPRGTEVLELLNQYFSNIVDLKFTSELEIDLIEIEKGTLKYFEVCKKYVDLLKQCIKGHTFGKSMSNEQCSCGLYMAVKDGEHGLFLRCKNYKKDSQGNFIQSCGKTVKLEKFINPRSRTISVVPSKGKSEGVQQRKKCPTPVYCNYTRPLSEGNAKCHCGIKMVVRVNSKTKQKFYGCANYKYKFSN